LQAIEITVQLIHPSFSLSPEATSSWHSSVARAATKGKPKKAAPKKAAPKKAAPKKPAPKKPAPKKAAPKKKKVTGSKGDPVQIILAKLAEMEQIGVTEVDESILLYATGYSRRDSNGYRAAAREILKELGYAVRTKTTWTLTKAGRDHLVENGVIEIPPEPQNNEEHHARLLAQLEKLVKAPKAKIEAIFGELEDGHWHTVEHLLSVSGYGRTDSNGYRNIMAGMKKLDLLEKDKKLVRFSDKAFQFGRP
jgi:hypothetical protein